MLLFASAVGWACLGQLDVVAVAPGRIVVGERTKTIQPLERSVVKRVLVQDGDHVTAGQALVELDATVAFADRRTVVEQIKSAQSERLRTSWLEAALDDRHGSGAALPARLSWPKTDDETATPLWSANEQHMVLGQLKSEWRDIQARRARAAAEMQRRRAEILTGREVLAKLMSTLPLVRQREQDFQALAAQGFVAHHAGQDRTRERIEMERDLDTHNAPACRSLLPRWPRASPARAPMWPRPGACCRSAMRRPLCDCSRPVRSMPRHCNANDSRCSVLRCPAPCSNWQPIPWAGLSPRPRC